MNQPNMLTEISRDEFREKYLLGRQVAHEGVRSFEARDTADQLVMVHLLGVVDGPEAVPWLAAVGALTPERRAGLLGAFLIEGEAVLVTEFQPQVRSLADWFVSTAAGRQATDAASTARDGERAAAGPVIAAGGADPGSVHAEATDTPPDISQGQEARAGQDVGEFTRMFGHDQRGSDSTETGAPQSAAAGDAASASAAVPPLEDAPKPPAPQAETEQGEFTRMFGSQAEDAYARPPAPQKPQQPKREPPKPVAPEKQPEKQQGEFTKLFGAGGDQTSGPRVSQTLAEQPPQEKPRRADAGVPKPTGEAPRSRPRIVWRDRKPGQATPEPPTPEPSTPPAPAPGQPPGQFTEIFGHELSSGSSPTPPSSGGPAMVHPRVEQPRGFEPPVPDTGPRKSVGDMVDPLSQRDADDYLKALGSAPRAEPPVAPPPQKPTGIQGGQSPDLPPPVTKPQAERAPGPSDYTRVISGRPAVPPPTPAPAPTPPPSQPKVSEGSAPTKVPTWLWVVLIAIVLLMVVLIALVVLT